VTHQQVRQQGELGVWLQCSSVASVISSSLNRVRVLCRSQQCLGFSEVDGVMEQAPVSGDRCNQVRDIRSVSDGIVSVGV
jgi:hypothetical protein